ncbi:MAG: hypothetical protein KBD64_08005 [Gammaproteobacteria bacterium]|nr:hypothetical protein [Gammaproteobacteria bacterium]
MALGLSDFIPDYLVPAKESNESRALMGSAPVKPLVETKRNSSATKSWYCNRNQNNAGNVFCKKNDDNQIVHSLTYNESDASGDRTNIVDNAVADKNYLGQDTSANQTTLQDKEVKDSLQKSQGGVFVPIQPSKDVNMNINQQQVQFNIKY